MGCWKKQWMVIDFIVGREIEVGGIYTGIVTNIKEHGAFVEFNGGHQGLLHISELSYEPVSRVSEVVSVGQKLSLMCIGQDVYGNIKLSLKATFPRPGILETNDVTEGSVTSAKETDGNASRVQEQQNSASELSLVGTIVTAKVYQIRAQGFVLDLGGGVRGVYRFEENNSRDFTIGDEMRVVCSGFSNKGIPVMSLVDDK
ncbi:hypothetical protein LR48_Vigan10g237500 [Vigna angularis]|uniref:S1 motif domain-containing protein n=1 Tax=Phaseolus angularis TaxID=3914 RepID=A0A0L9VNG7_PHAAN|nr:hypothetical protein LR48_Vigan10g237500 [Vigna angularis]